MSHDMHMPETQKSYTTPYFAIFVAYHVSPVTLQLFRIIMEEV